MNIITGYKGTPHITSQQDRDINSAIFSDGVYILNIGSRLAATIVSANEVTIADGLVIAQGCAAEVERGTSESLTIDNGAQGMLRKDLIVLRYTKDASTGVEDMEIAVIKGTPAASNPALPSYASGSIANGDTLVEFPLYTVNLDGITLESVTRNAEYAEVASASALETVRSTLQSAVNSLASTLATVSSRVGTATLSTAAQTVTAAVNELLTKINTLTSGLSSVTSRTTALENKATAIVGTYKINVDAGATQYLRLHALSMYVIIINGGTTDNNMRGLYLAGVTNNNVIGIKAISAAGSVAVSDGGSGLIKFVNNSSVTMRLTIICTYGTSI